MRAGSRYVPPAPGMIASRVSGSATVVVDAKTRRCVVRASSRPPPNAGAARADMVGMGRVDMEVKVPRREARKLAVSSDVNVALSFRSAPAQKLESTSLARISARVAPVSPSAWMLSTWWLSSESNWRDMAFRAAGRFNERILIDPECGAGTLVTFITGCMDVE